MSDGQFDGVPKPGAAGAITGRSHEPGYGALDRALAQMGRRSSPRGTIP